MATLANFKFRKKLTIDNTLVGTSLTDFPVLVKLDNINFDFNNAETNGDDIRFTSDDGTTLLKFEREDHDSIGEKAFYWVKVPSVSNTVDTDIFIYYGNASAIDGEDPANTWNSDYKAVYHLKESGNGTVGEYIDSTSNSHNGQGQGTVPTQVDSIIFKGQNGAGSNSFISVLDSDDFFLNGDFTLEWKMRWITSISSGTILGQDSGGGVNPKWFVNYDKLSTGDMAFHVQPGATTIAFTWTPVADTDFHCVLKRVGNDFKYFVDSVQTGGTQTNSISLPNVADVFNLFTDGEGFDFFSGVLDEVRITKGLARSDNEIITLFNSDNNTLLTFGVEEELIIEVIDNLEITDSIIVTDTIVQELDNLLISDSIITQNTTIEQINNLEISDSIIVTDTNVDAKFASKILSINPLIFVTDTSPIEIVKVDITDPSNLTSEVKTVTDVNNAKDVAINTTNDFIYIAGDLGQVVKVEVANLSNQTIIDLSDTDDLLTIETNSNFGLTYAGTENNIGELYIIDERDTFNVDSDFQVLSPQEFKLESDFNITANFKVDSDFQVLAEETVLLNSDFKCLTKPTVTPPPTVNPLDVIEPINLTDFQVFIDNVELEDTDLILNSISITHSIAEQSRASFQLSRKHDQLNTTLEGVSSTITNQNNVEIRIKGITEFNGQISELNCQYNNNIEFIQVDALAEEKVNQFNNITMSLPSLDSRLSLYDILVQNPKIFNPFVDPDNEDNPPKFKGIRVNLGTKIEQRISRFLIFDSSGNIASDIQEGIFNPIQNWTYFWSPTVTKFGNVDLGQVNAVSFLYIGTSLAPVSEDLWDLTNSKHRRQRIYDDIETDLGVYEAGEAPFQEISVRNGIKITKPKYVDENDRLSVITEASFNFVDFAKLVADLELEKLKNINGVILPDTSCTFNLTVDGYLYYDISLLTKINVDNTTDSNVYQNSNGFPISVKSITITSADRKVNIEADNLKSVKELEEINSQFPDENDQEFNEEERRIFIALKSDMRTRLKVG